MEMAKANDLVTFKVIDPDSGFVYEFLDIPIERLSQIRSQFHHAPNGAKGNGAPNFDGLKKSLSEKAKKFVRLLHDNPTGIRADYLAEKLGFQSGTQIGGMTGGGIKKNANKFHVELTDVYSIEVGNRDGQRMTTYKPGKEIARLV